MPRDLRHDLTGTDQALPRHFPYVSPMCFESSCHAGVYGVSFLVVWFSVTLLSAGILVLCRPEKTRSWLGEIALPLLAAVGVAWWGMRQMAPQPAARTLRVALVQPSIPQTVIWDPAGVSGRFAQLLELSEAALTNKPDLLVWPEAAMPSLLRWDTNLYNGATLMDSVARLARKSGAWIVLGADDAEPTRDGEAKFFNASFLINPAGEIAASYRKRKLVMFGEFVPLARWLPFLRDFSGVGGDFTPGERPESFPMRSLGTKTSTLICFEDTFPHVAREHVEPDTDFLLNLTNDGWFGRGAAQWQHAANAVFRAVENGRPLVRCANNGLTCWIDGRGRMHEVFFPGDPDVYRAGCKLAEVPLLDGRAGPATVYWRHGDWFGWSCVGFAVLMTGRATLRNRGGKPASL